MRILYTLLVFVGIVSAFDRSTLIPSIEEAQQALAEMSVNLRTMTTSDIGRVYHEVLIVEELLTKMRDTLLEQQDADTNFTVNMQADLTADLAAFESALTRLLAEESVHNDTLKAQISNFTATAKTIAEKEAQANLVEQRLNATRGDCERLLTRHDTAAAATAADISSVAKILEQSAQVECSQLTHFIQTMNLPVSPSVSLLELSECPCPCQMNLIQSDGMFEGCECPACDVPTGPSEPVEFNCDKRRENIRVLLRSLLEQLHGSSAQESSAFQRSFSACKSDEDTQEAKYMHLVADLAHLNKLQSNLSLVIEDLEHGAMILSQSVQATKDAISDTKARRYASQVALTDRFNQRSQQADLINKILQLISALTNSQYSDIHLSLHENCPSLCSGHGVCIGSSCECAEGFVGVDCSIDLSSRHCPFLNQSAPCTDSICSGTDFSGLQQTDLCAGIVCEYCRTNPLLDPGCVYAPTAMFCAERDRANGCSTVMCPMVEPQCGIRRTVKANYTGCCFNPLLDCVDKCVNAVCPAEPPTCRVGYAVRYPLRDCCFNPETDCADECSVLRCNQEEPVCPIGKKVRTPYTSCCFNATLDCENECTSVVCDEVGLPVDICRSRGLRWTGTTADCCFDPENDCASGDDIGQEHERFALEALYNATEGKFWYHQSDTHWMTSAWICYWYGVECSGVAGRMSVTGLLLPANGLSGMLPKDLALLSNLTFLDLSSNFIGGPIPREFGALKKLRSLKLRQNELTGIIPDVLGTLPVLEVLDLGFNFLNGTLPESLHPSDSMAVSCGSNCMCNVPECLPIRPKDTTNHSGRYCDPCQ